MADFASTSRGRARVYNRRFFGWVAAFFVLLVLVGFARTYFLHSLFHVPAPSELIEIHGILMTGWVLLFFVQSLLVLNARLGWHRKLGVAGVFWAAVIIPVGCMATLFAARREIQAHGPLVPQKLNVLGLELAQMCLFAGLVSAAVLLRKRGDYHKRLMMVATLCILPNAIVRLVLISNIRFLHSNIVIIGIWATLVFCIVGIDSKRLGRLHPASGWSSVLAVAVLILAWLESVTAAWRQFWIQMLG